MKFLIAFLLVFNAAAGFGQDNKKAIENAFNAYGQSLVNKDYPKMADYITEDVFNFLKKDDYIRLMEQTFTSPEFDIAVINPKLLGIGDIKQIKGKNYAVLNYSNGLEIKPKANGKDAPSGIIVKKTLEDGFGAGNVAYNSGTGIYRVQMKSKLCAISADGENWKFIALEASLKPLLQKFMPAEIISLI